MASPREYPVMLFAVREAWSNWLQEHHASTPGVWLRFAKKGRPIETLTHSQALDEALCYGWIDGQAKADDADSWLQKFTPRGPKSLWSKVNREKVEAFLTSGRLQPAGLAAMQAAQRDGRWTRAYDPPSKAIVPEDLLCALASAPEAQAFFETLSKTNRYSILFRIQTAVRPETRARRIALLVAMLGRGETFH